MDEDLDAISREQLIAEARTLRDGIRRHRDSSSHDLCWHRANLASHRCAGVAAVYAGVHQVPPIARRAGPGVLPARTKSSRAKMPRNPSIARQPMISAAARVKRLPAPRSLDAISRLVSQSHDLGTRACGQGEHFLQFVDEVVYAYEEGFPAGMWAAGNEFGRMLGQHEVARIASPATDFAVRHQCQATQIVAPTGMPEVCEQILKSQLQVSGGNHVAVQHEASG